MIYRGDGIWLDSGSYRLRGPLDGVLEGVWRLQPAACQRLR